MVREYHVDNLFSALPWGENLKAGFA